MGKGADDSDRPDVPTRTQRPVSVIITPSTLSKPQEEEEPDPQEQIKDRVSLSLIVNFSTCLHESFEGFDIA